MATNAQDDDSDGGQISGGEEMEIRFTNNDGLRRMPSNEAPQLVESGRDGGVDEGGGGASAPDTFPAYMTTDILTSSGPFRAGTINSTTSSQKGHVLIHDAALWAHEETSDKITLLNGKPIIVAVNKDISPASVQLCGVLGTYLSEAKAKRIGKQWVYDQGKQWRALKFLSIRPFPSKMALDVQDWNGREGWQQTADDSWGYSISEYPLKIHTLIVSVTERVVDDSSAEEVCQDIDDDFILVGLVGRRKRVAAKKVNGNERTGPNDQTAKGGDGTARNCKSGERGG